MAQAQAPGVESGVESEDVPSERDDTDSQAISPQGPDAVPRSAPTRPWAEGISEADQRRALALFRQGNTRFAEVEYGEAAQLYRDAIGHWSHPAIHGNLAICMVHLDEPIEAYKHIEEALRWGADPFEAHVHQQLVTNQTLLRGQLATIEVECDEEGAELALDGETLFEGPSRASRVVRAGEHRIVGSKAGFLTYNRVVTVLPGVTEQVNVELVPLDNAAVFERRWPQWIPWTVLAGGLVLAGVGAGLQVSAAGNIESYEDELALLCPSGCEPNEIPEAVQSLETRGITQNRVASCP